MGTWTLYTSGDIAMLTAILNGVAMVCTQLTLIWGFALLASTYIIMHSVTSGGVESAAGAGGAALSRGALSAAMPLILALLLTSDTLKCRVQVESTLNASVTAVDNVPFVIAVIPVGGSILTSNVGTVIRTAFQTVNPNYDVMSANGNGFLDPMKRLLGARSALTQLNGLDSEVRTLVSSCLSKDFVADYGEVARLVINAGNTGATAAQTLDIYDTSSTAIGALLYQASLNTSGVVPNLTITGSTGIPTCPIAAAQVQADINAALVSPEFGRVIQGAINAMDAPNPAADYSLDHLLASYMALRSWNTVGAAIAGGQAQANAEAINWLFYDMVGNSLNCLRADSSDKVGCEAAMVQANEFERANVQAAANEVPMLKYAGSFGNYLIALVIGLGPVIGMFMMFAGVNAGKCVKTAAHIIVWPMLVMNVGAELVNAMLSTQFANFMTSVTQGGFASQATMMTLYKELSLQIGAGSHLMASLPVLMSIIFGLGATAGLVSVAGAMNPRGEKVGAAAVPELQSSEPLVRNSAPMTANQGPGFAVVAATGSLQAANASAELGRVARDVSRTTADVEARVRSQTEGQDTTARVERALNDRDYKSLGLSNEVGDSLRNSWMNNLRNASSGQASQSETSQRSDSAGSTIQGNAGFRAGTGSISGRPGFGMSGGVDRSGSVNSQDTNQTSDSYQHLNAVDRARALERALGEEQSRRSSSQAGHETARTVGDMRSKVHNYAESLSHSQSTDDTYREGVTAGSAFVAQSQRIGSAELANFATGSHDFRMFQLSQGTAFEGKPSAAKYMAHVQRNMDNLSMERSGGGDPLVQQTLVRHAAAAMMFGDASLPQAERFAALQYLLAENKAMLHGSIEPMSARESSKPDFEIPLPRQRVNFGDRLETGATHANPKLIAPDGRGVVAQVDRALEVDQGRLLHVNDESTELSVEQKLDRGDSAGRRGLKPKAPGERASEKLHDVWGFGRHPSSSPGDDRRAPQPGSAAGSPQSEVAR